MIVLPGSVNLMRDDSTRDDFVPLRKSLANRHISVICLTSSKVGFLHSFDSWATSFLLRLSLSNPLHCCLLNIPNFLQYRNRPETLSPLRTVWVFLHFFFVGDR